ncbi:MAG: hypothetical protein AAGA83_15140 [Cyanobacteria bacterium P01_F01_bin.116]
MIKLLKWGLVGIAIAAAPACLCESEFCRVGGAGGIAIGSGSGSSAPSRPMLPPPPMKIPGTLTQQEWQTLQYLAWPQTRTDIQSTFGPPSRVEGTRAVYGIPGGQAIAILYEGDQATGYVFAASHSEEDDSRYEIHGATNAKACQNILRRFLREGRRVRLVKVRRNPFNKGGGVLEVICYFDGEDANPEATPFEDKRFPQDDTAYP